MAHWYIIFLMKRFSILLSVAIVAIISCKKSSNTPDPAPTKPRVGSKFTYRYKTFSPAGVVLTSQDLVYSITAELTLGGEKWFQFSDPSGTPWLLMNVKTGGLYQYANNASQLLCKSPATINETYMAYNNGATENFTVKAVDSLLAAPIADVKVTMYESTSGGNVTGYNFYNADYWLVKREIWQLNPVLIPPASTRRFRWELTNVIF
jgi:hypothetical protein